MGELDHIVEETITMREINATLQKMEGFAPTCGHERDDSNGIPERDAFTKPFERDFELDTCESLRRRKRKQENINIQRVSSGCAPNNHQPVLSQQDRNVARLQEPPINPGGDLQGGVSPEISRSRKKRRETNKLHEVGLDISLRTDGSHSLHALGFDISVSSSVAVGIKHASCNILSDKDAERAVGGRLAAGLVNNKRGERVTNFCEQANGTTAVASGVTSKDLCSMSTTKKAARKTLGEFVKTAPVLPAQYCRQSDQLGATLPTECKSRGQRPARSEKVSSEDEAESQKLRMAVAVLHSQFKSLYNFAESGSKDCGHCQSIKEELSKLCTICDDTFSSQLSPRKSGTPIQGSSLGEALMSSSPVGSCTIERAVEKEACKRQLVSGLHEGNLESSFILGRDVCSKEDGEPDQPFRNNVHEDGQEASDAECHLCIELGSSQSEDRDAEETRVGSMERDDCDPNVARILTERACSSQRLHPYQEENHECSGNMLRRGEVEKHADSFQGVEDDRKDEDLSAKSSKEENQDCWGNMSKHGEVSSEIDKCADSFQGVVDDRKGEELSAITRESGDSYVGAVDGQAEKDGYIDLKCGCTSQKYGDTIGILRLYQNGKLEIQCQCSIGCINGKPMSPASFERHGGRGASKKWRDTIWIVLGDQKIQFSKVKGLDAFVRRFKESGRTVSRPTALPKQSNHRDEFVECKTCSKRRRFRRKTKEECRLFHDASMNLEWECSNYPYGSFNSCQDDEEREARQAYRGCARSRACPGCIECVCLGCFTCRFEDCDCRLCTEYIANNK